MAKKYHVTYEHEVVITYDALVEADSEEEAIQKVEDGDYISEQEKDWQGQEIRVLEVEEGI